MTANLHPDVCPSRMRSLCTLALGAAVAALACTACAACASEPAATAPAAGGAGGAGAGGASTSTTHPTTSGTGGQSTTTTSVGGSGGTTSTSSGGASPCPGWPGWRQFEEAPVQPFICVPESASALPPPFVWTPCPIESGFAAGCRQLLIDYPYDTIALGAPAVDLAHDPPLLALVRTAEEYRMIVGGDIDGPMRTAMVDAEAGADGILWATLANNQLVDQGKLAAQVQRAAESDEYVVGYDFDHDTSPRVLWKWPVNDGHGIGTSGSVWVSEDEFNIGVAKWGEPWSVVYSGVPTSRQQHFVYAWHDFVTWLDGNYPDSCDLRAYTPDRGVYSLIAYPGDSSQGVYALGTDGADMVWVHGHDRKPGDDVYPVQDIMTSPFTVDPEKMQPRRLRSHPSPWSSPDHYAVGCGYAAYSAQPGQTWVVRLSDGWTWLVPNPGCKYPSLKTGFCTGLVLGLNCEEVFISQASSGRNVARIRLDALGPGQPPD